MFQYNEVRSLPFHSTNHTLKSTEPKKKTVPKMPFSNMWWFGDTQCGSISDFCFFIVNGCCCLFISRARKIRLFFCCRQEYLKWVNIVHNEMNSVHTFSLHDASHKFHDHHFISQTNEHKFGILITSNFIWLLLHSRIYRKCDHHAIKYGIFFYLSLPLKKVNQSTN